MSPVRTVGVAYAGGSAICRANAGVPMTVRDATGEGLDRAAA